MVFKCFIMLVVWHQYQKTHTYYYWKHYSKDCKKHNVHINTEKRFFIRPSIKFCGFIISKDELPKCHEKVDAILKMSCRIEVVFRSCKFLWKICVPSQQASSTIVLTATERNKISI
ncbi:hypothetical protein PR048_016095 [Dryococelus australis]|uniref:Uncharacterized protein n=1 Tax=Dryococelus australis TaxID=614101 RepID=A0ABQ9HIS6_9NEOP|nr:hypothetical protein PR048_016095 [Dryococelus australis]